MSHFKSLIATPGAGGRGAAKLPRSFGSGWPYFLGVGLYALLIALYVGLRFAWGWLPGDAATLTAICQNTYLEGTVSPIAGVYPLGYAYPTFNTFLAYLTGLSIEALQVYVQPFLIALLVPVSYVAFRAMLEDNSMAALASLFLFLQPDFLFEAVRGSHAKATWLLALGMLFVLARSLQAGSSRAMAGWVSLFYLLAYGLISSNVFFASSYVFGLAFAFLGGWALARWQRSSEAPQGHLRRLLYVALACSVLVFLFIFYVYPPALHLAGTLNTTLDRLSGFFLDVETGTNPYQYVQATWLSPGLYVALSSLSWLMLAFSFANWCHKAWVLLWRRQPLTSGQLLLWLLYTAFATLLALSVLVDLSGALSANLQVRLFPHLMVVAIPLAAQVMGHLVAAAWRRGQAARRAAAALLAVAVLLFSAASLFKATNEPLLNNRWLFSSSDERAAIVWAGPRLAGPWVWLGLDGRLRAVLTAYGDWDGQGLEPYTGPQVAERYDLLLSEVMAAQATRLGVPLPNVRGRLRVYDNGAVSLHHARPRTPYQR